ncbi:MAG: HEPN domain-containing protein [Melioribacteraceae bacterium]|nr:HEPN domain-containing protein [Melioribacteraceae bacterium]
MNEKPIEKEKIITHWVENSTEDYKTMLTLFGARRYSWSLFVGHLVIEKLLKAYYVKTNNGYPPFIHNLLRLAVASKILVSDELKLKLTTISAFNINARYDDYKNSFHKRCTPEFTSEWINKIKELRLWIIEQIKA